MGLLVEPIKLDLALSDTDIGILNGLAFAAFYILMGLPLGRLVDTKHRPRLLGLCVAFWSIACMGCGLAINYLALFIARICVGIGEAALNPAAISLISDYFEKDKVTRPLGVFTLGIYVGGGLAILIGGALIAWALSLPPINGPFGIVLNGWRTVFIAAGAPGLLIAIIVILTIREPRTAVASVQKNDPSILDLWFFLRNNASVFVLLFGGLVAFGFNVHAVLGWYPAMMIRTYGVSAQEVAVGYGFAYLIGGTAGSLLTATFTKLLRERGVSAPQLVLTASALFIMLCASICAPLMPSLATSILVSGVTLFTWAITITTAFAMLSTITPDKMRGTMIGLFLVIMNATGGALGTVLVGWITDTFLGSENLGTALIIVACCSLPPAICLLLLARRGFVVLDATICVSPEKQGTH